MPINSTNAKTLPKLYREYLQTAICELTDQLFEDIAFLSEDSSPDAIQSTTLFIYLPATRQRYYNALFAKRFLACVLTVAWKYRSTEAQSLACVAEELALHALFSHAEVVAEAAGHRVDFGDYEDLFFEDTDFKLLFQPQMDGVEEGELAQQLGLAYLSVRDWFKPFRKNDPVNPYAADE